MGLGALLRRVRLLSLFTTMLNAMANSFIQLDYSGMLVGVAASLSVLWLVRVTSESRRFKLPPGPMEVPWPLHYITYLAMLWKKINPIELANKLAERYGDVVYVNDGGTRIVFLASVEAVKEALVQQADVTSGREEDWELTHCCDYKGGIIFSEGAGWVAHRKFGLAALRNFGMGKKSLEHKINEEARMLREALTQHAVGKPFNPSSVITNAVSNIICAITFGRRFEYDDAKFKEMAGRLAVLVAEDTDVFSELPSFIMTACRRNMVELRDQLLAEIAEHKATFDSSDVRDVIDMYLREAQQARKPEGDVEPEIIKDKAWAIVFDFFLAGTETTSNTLLWALLLMAGHQDKQEKIAAEIEAVIGQDTPPSFEHRKSMPYTEATLAETLRFRPIAPNGIPHRATADLKVKGYDIPKGTNLAMNILYIHHDPETWGDPEVFRPDRFLSEDGKSLVQPDAYMPFGAGRRICLGEQLAKMEMFLFFTNILQQFRVTFPPGYKPDYGYGHRSLTLQPAQYELILEERY